MSSVSTSLLVSCSAYRAFSFQVRLGHFYRYNLAERKEALVILSVRIWGM